MNDIYFGQRTGEELGNELIGKIDDYYEFMQSSGLLETLRKSYRQYYNLNSQNKFNFTDKINQTGSQGEYSNLKVNHYRNLIQHILSIVTNTKPEWQSIASNTDYESQAQTLLANGLLDYYMTDKRLERHFKKACEMSLYAFEGWVSMRWDGSMGKAYGVHPELGVEIKEGDIDFNTHNILDVIRDPYRETSKQDWYILRTKKNKHDLAKQYPEKAQEILALQGNSRKGISVDLADNHSRYGNESNDIEVFEFYHARSESMPDGKYALFLDSNLVLLETPLPYRNIPLFRCVTSELEGTPFGYSNAIDLLPLQNASNILYSTIITNQATHGVQNIVTPKGSDISVTQVGSGMNLIEYDKQLGPPQPLNLTNTPAEIFNFLGKVENTMELISGVNQISRGQAPASMSGAAMALLHSQSLTFASNLQQEYQSLIEDVGTSIVEMLQDYATVPRIANISGKSNKGIVREFSNQDLDAISRVTIRTVNPVSKTHAGRMEMARDLLNTGLIKNPEDYIQVLTTGKLEPMIEGQTSEYLQIKSENESLSEGEPVPVVATDDHILHIREHKSVLADPETRKQPQLVQTTLAHIKEHIDALKTVDPELLQILGIQPLQPKQNVPQDSAPNPDVMDATNPIAGAAQQVNMPNLPKNLMTGEEYDPTGNQQ